MKLIFTISLLTIFLLPSCKKLNISLSEKEQMLTSHGWIGSTIIVNGNTAVWALCYRDNCWHFNPDKTLVIDIGQNKCSNSETNHKGSWHLSEDETQILYNYGYGEMICQIQVSESELILTYLEDNYIRVDTYITCN